MLRTRVGIGGELDDNASYMLMLENYRVLGDPDNDVNEIYQATFTVNNFLFNDFDVTFGRMPVAYGRERIIGKEDWAMDPAERMLFEGYHGRYSFENGWFDYFNFKTCESYGEKYDFTGAWPRRLGHLRLLHALRRQRVLLVRALRHPLDHRELGRSGHRQRQGLHLRRPGGLRAGRPALYGEVTAQTGTTYAYELATTKDYAAGEMDISTLGWYAGVFYDFDATAEPYIGFEYNYASGEDGTTDEMDAFGSLAGSSRDYLGIMNIVPWTDVVAMRFAGGFSPVDGLDLSADFFMFERDQEVAEETKIGTELDIALDYMLNEDVDLHGGVGMFTYDEASAIAPSKSTSYGSYMEPGDSMIFAWFGASVGF